MATEDRTEDAAESTEAGNGTGKAAIVTGGINALKARVAAKRGAAGKQEMIQGDATSASDATSAAGSDASAPTILPSDAGVPDDEITSAAKDELARLASIRQGDAGVSGEQGHEDSDEDDPEQAIQEGSGDTVMEGLAAEGSTLYERRQAEIAEAKARPGGKGKSTAKGKAGAGTAAKEREKEKKEREKAKAREKSEKAKEKEKERKEKEKEKKARLKESEDARKKKLADQKAQRAQERAAAKVPDVVKRENKAVQAAFAEDYTLAGPKSDRNPNGLGLRRAKADRGDFAAGYVMAIRRLKSQGQGTVGGAAKFAAAG